MSRYVDTAGHPIEQHVLVDSSGSLVEADDTDGQALIFTKSRNYVWDTGTLAWVRETQPGGGGGGGASTIADGADVAEGTTTDVKVVGDNQGTVSAKLRGINTALAGTLNVSAVQSGTWNVGTLTSITNAVDISDRAVRLLGHVTVDNASIAVTQSVPPWQENITQFGGNAIATGVGASGVGVPRVTVSNDSNILATQSGTWNVGTLTSITNAVTVTQSTASSLLATVSQGGAPWQENITQVGGTSLVLGQAKSSASIPVVFASDQSVLTVDPTSYGDNQMVGLLTQLIRQVNVTNTLLTMIFTSVAGFPLEIAYPLGG